METELAECCYAAFGPSAISPSFTFLPVFLDIDGDTSVLTPSLLQGQRDGELISFFHSKVKAL